MLGAVSPKNIHMVYIHIINYAVTNVIVVAGVELQGSLLLTFIVYVVPLSPLTTLSSTVTAHVLPFTLVTGAVYVIAHELPLKLVTHVALVRYPESLLNADTFVGTVGIDCATL